MDCGRHCSQEVRMTSSHHTRACAHLSAAAGCLWIITEMPHYSAHISFSPFIISYRLFKLRLLSINIIIRSLLAFLALFKPTIRMVGGLWLTLKTAWRTGSKVLCITGVFSWSGNGEGHFLITAHWHIDPQTASGGQSPSEPLQMLSQEISSKTSSTQHTNTNTHTHSLTLPETKTRYIFELWIDAHRGGRLLCVVAVLVSTEERIFWRAENYDLYVWMGRIRVGGGATHWWENCCRSDGDRSVRRLTWLSGGSPSIHPSGRKWATINKALRSPERQWT